MLLWLAAARQAQNQGFVTKVEGKWLLAHEQPCAQRLEIQQKLEELERVLLAFLGLNVN